VDGVGREARISCTGCTLDPNPHVLTLSDDQIESPARKLEEVGVLELDGTDYGDECCDQFGFTLVYERGDRSSQIEGTGSRWPPALMDAVRGLASLAHGYVPALLAPTTGLDDWPTAPILDVDAAEVQGPWLTLDLTYGGGCRPHRMDVVAVAGWLDGLPTRIDAILTHDDGGDVCDALVSERRSFDLGSLVDAWVIAQGPVGDAPTALRLRLRVPTSGEPIYLDLTL